MADPTEEQIIQRESGGKPYIGWGGTDLSNAPLDQYGFPIWAGKMGPKGISHAAGLYQFQPGTWATYAKRLGVTDFSPESQRRVYQAARAAEGATPWAASEPTASPEVERTVRGRTPEEQAAMGTPLEIRGRPKEDQFDPALVLSMLMTQPSGAQAEEPQPESPLKLLDTLLEQASASPQQPGGGGIGQMPTGAAAPQPAATVPALQGPVSAPGALGQPRENVIAQQSAPLGIVATPGPQNTPPIPPVATAGPRPAPLQMQEGAPGLFSESRVRVPTRMMSETETPADLSPAEPGSFLDRLLAGPAQAGREFLRSEADLSERDFSHEPLIGVGEGGELTGRLPALAEKVVPFMAGAAPGGAMGAGAGLTGLRNLYSTPASRAGASARRALSEEARGNLRSVSGTARREKAVAEAELEQYRSLMAPLLPDFRRFIADVHAGNPKPAPSQMMDFINHVEGVGTLPAGHPLEPLAQTLRNIFGKVRSDIQREIPGMQFIEDYLPHRWLEKARPGTVTHATGKQGSGQSLRKRSLMTTRAGIEAGLTPRFLDPIENTLRYVQGMEDYLAMHKAFNAARDAGYVQYHVPGSEPDGWTELRGRWTEVSPQGMSVVSHAYAPEGYAQIWNNYFSRGFRESAWGRAIYDGLLRAKNTTQAFLFGLSGYHPLAMMQESQASSIARSVGALAAGDMNEAMKQLGLGAMTGVKAGKDVFGLGKKVEQHYLRQSDFGPEMDEIVNLYEKAGGRATGRGAEWSGSMGEDFFKAWKRGRLGTGLRERFGEAAAGKPPVTAGLRIAAQVTDEMARVMQSLTAPVFDKAIPRLKNAAFYDEMAGWLRQNPTATHPEKLAQARHLVDLMDDRFGEMIMDNIFWAQRVKQTLQIMSVSLGWELGSIRSMGKGLPDLLRGKPARVRYLVGLGAAIALENAVYQYLKTGKPPGEGKDFLFPQTGGKTPEGKTERAILPGFEKDFVGYWHNPSGEFFNKLSGIARLPMEMVSGKDRFGKDIAPYPQRTPSWLRNWGQHILGQMAPIPTQQERYKGTNISPGEAYGAGIRPAPAWVTDEARTDTIETAGRIRALQGEARGIAAHGARTLTERRDIENQIRIINEEIRGLQRGLQTRQKERAPTGNSIK